VFAWRTTAVQKRVTNSSRSSPQRASLRIKRIVWIDKFVDKIETRHHITTSEVEEVLHGERRVQRIAKGDVDGEDVYLALGRTDAGRYLAVFFILKARLDVLPISARDMDGAERKRYGRK
jgi:uncharacterized DUF497 family protein